MSSVVAVHGGAGYHRVRVDKVCAEALRRSKHDFISTVKFLEDHPSTNCGTGSNLTLDGLVECEASVCYSKGNIFGAIGAVKRIRNPVEVASLLAQDSVKSDCGLVPPSILVADGAESYAESKGVVLCSNCDLVTEGAKRQWAAAKAKVDVYEKLRLDTVGAVSMIDDGSCAAACSSGGFIVKASGRLGLATQIGGAVWAEQDKNQSVAVTLSGCGEYISRTLLAEKIALALSEWDTEKGLLSECIRSVFMDSFYNSVLLSSRPKSRILAGGLVLLKNNNEDYVELFAFHNTEHFPFAFVDDNKVSKIFSRRLKEGGFIIQSFPLRF